MHEVLTIKEVAERLKVSERTVRNWIEKGDLTGYRLGGQYRVNTSDLNLFIEKSKVKGD